jgi:hypothetical protein
VDLLAEALAEQSGNPSMQAMAEEEAIPVMAASTPGAAST